MVALLADPRVTVEVIADGTHVHPAIYAEVSGRVGPHRSALVTDAMAAAAMSDGAYRLGSLAVTVTDGVARVAGTDTIAGSTATMDGLFRHAYAWSGPDEDLALLRAARQTSTNPARAVGAPPADLAPGSVADLVVLDPDLAVRAVMVAGAWVDGVG